jgi:pimeloyl-ACP methyl ester carboxylesterase
MTAQIVTLPDGRALAFHEYGDPDGVPCVFTTGTPVSGEMGMGYDEAARAAGVRLISIDKPGYGRSSFDPRRSLPRYAEDVRFLADHLGLGRFAAMGESGGGPHVFAIGHYLAERVTTVVSVAGLGPAHEPWVRKDMIPFNKRMFWMAQRAPWLVGALMAPFARAFREPADQARRGKALAKVFAQMSEQDRAVLEAHPEGIEMLTDAIAGGYAQGTKPAVQEYQMFARPWEFRLEDITVPTHLWHGTDDNNVPISVARHIATLVPDVTTHFIEGGGHAAATDRHDEIMAVIRAAAPTSEPGR